MGHFVDLKNAAGHTGPFRAVTLRWPLSPGEAEPFYIFIELASGLFVFVGTISGKVTSMDSTDRHRDDSGIAVAPIERYGVLILARLSGQL